MDRPPGIDQDRVTEWFRQNLPEATPPLTFTLVAGGRSNLTFCAEDAAGRRFALRRPPTGHILPTAHDMGREHRIIAALGATDVPVPPALAYCADESVTGAPFYVMGWVQGRVLRDEAAARALPELARRTAGEDLVDVLVRIHSVDPEAVGLGDLGRRDGYIERQLHRWHTQYERSRTGRDVPLVEEMHRRLLAAVPRQQRSTIVHGDYRLDNTLLGDDGRVRAVLDWELCTLGDPLADVGLLMVYWAEPGDETPALLMAPTTAPGFPRRAEILDRYAAASGLDLSGIGFYVAFAYWKLACILQGVYHRYVNGAGGGDPTSVAGFVDHIERLAQLSVQATEDF